MQLALVTVADPGTEPDPRRAVIGCYLQMLEVADVARRLRSTCAGCLRQPQLLRVPRPRSRHCSSALTTASSLSASPCGPTRWPRSTFFAVISWREPSLDARSVGDLRHDGGVRRDRSRHRARGRRTRSRGDRARGCGSFRLARARGRVGRCLGGGRRRPASAPEAAAPRRGAERRRDSGPCRTRALAPLRGFDGRRFLRAGSAEARPACEVVPSRARRCPTRSARWSCSASTPTRSWTLMAAAGRRRARGRVAK